MRALHPLIVGLSLIGLCEGFSAPAQAAAPPAPSPLLIQDAEYPEGKGEAVTRAYREMGLPTGPRFFVEFRGLLLEHTDTYATGPTTAGAYLRDLDASPKATFSETPPSPPAPRR